MMRQAVLQTGLALPWLWGASVHAAETGESGSEETEEHEREDAAEIVVTGTRTAMPLGDSPVATEVISRLEIERSGAEDLAGLLEEHPGISLFRSYLGAGVRIQGMEPEHVLVLVDGERVLGAKDGVIDLSRFPAEGIERVEIVKGPSSALYGSDAMGGVINIITREAAAPFSAHLHARYGGFSTLDASGGAGFRRGDLSSQFTGGYHRSDGYDLDPSDQATNGSALNQFDFGNQTKIFLSPDFWVTGKTTYLRRDLQGVDVSTGGALLDRSNRIEDFHASLKPRLLLDAQSLLGFDAAVSVYRDQYLADQRGADVLDVYQETRENMGQLAVQYDRLVQGSHAVTAGVEGFSHQMASDRLSKGEGERYRLGAYLQDSWVLSAFSVPLTLVPGARVDFDTWFGVYPAPKMAVRLDPTEDLVVRASYGWGYRAPGFKELLLFFENPGRGYVVEGSPDLRPETSFSYQLGFEATPGGSVWISAAGFYNEIEDLIGFTSLDQEAGGPVRYGYANVESAMTGGVETALHVDQGAFSTELGYTFTETRDNGLERRLEGRPVHYATGALHGGMEHLGLGGMARAGFSGSRSFYVDTDGDNNEEEVLADPYLTLDLRLAWNPAAFGEVFIGIDNVLDAGDALYLTISPRFFYGGITGRFATGIEPGPQEGS